MTEKNASFGNNFTPEQRAAALKRATEMRAARAEYLGRVKSGEVSIADALEAGKGDPVVGRIKAKRLLMALPGIGAAKTRRGNTSLTAFERPSSMVKRSLSQSQEEPNFFNCSMILPPYSFFHSHAFSRKPSLPRSCLSMPCFFRVSMILTSVAILAWSVPGCHSAL